MDFKGEIEVLLSLHGLFSLIILSLLELILGVDNIIFVSLLLTKIPEQKRFKARVTALSLAFIMRIIMLLGIVLLARITTTIFVISSFQVSIKDILFFIGGAYLTFTTIKEITVHIKGKGKRESDTDLHNKQHVYKSIIFQIILVDILFSFDSIFTAIGIIPNFIIMTIAVGLGMIFMIYLSGKTSAFIEKYPTIKTIALGFIIGVGLLLITQALHLEIPKVYLYATLIVALAFEGIKTRIKRSQKQ